MLLSRISDAGTLVSVEWLRSPSSACTQHCGCWFMVEEGVIDESLGRLDRSKNKLAHAHSGIVQHLGHLNKLALFCFGVSTLPSLIMQNKALTSLENLSPIVRKTSNRLSRMPTIYRPVTWALAWPHTASKLSFTLSPSSGPLYKMVRQVQGTLFSFHIG